jgi:hypothetical protein
MPIGDVPAFDEGLLQFLEGVLNGELDFNLDIHGPSHSIY